MNVNNHKQTTNSKTGSQKQTIMSNQNNRVKDNNNKIYQPPNKVSDNQDNSPKKSDNNQQKIFSSQFSKKELWIWGLSTVAICIVCGLIAKLLGGNMKHFETHTLPPMTAPTWVFPIAWGILYPLIGIAGFMAFTSRPQTPQTRKWDIIWFAINLVLNIIWPLFFYRLDLLILSTIICGLVLISASIVCYRFYYRSLISGALYTIYTIWLLYAFYLNLSICLLNV